MLLIRPLPQSTRAGRRLRAPRRFLLIETPPRPRFGQRRYVFDDIPLVTRPTAMLCAPARLDWNDAEFRAIRRAVSKHQAIVSAWDGDHGTPDHLAYCEAWAECEALAHAVFTPEPETIRDVFLRAEMLTMHYGDGCLSELLEANCPAERLLGGLLAACWKVGGAANVEAYDARGAANV